MLQILSVIGLLLEIMSSLVGGTKGIQPYLVNANQPSAFPC